MAVKKYNYIIAGAGCAGLSLAYHLSQSVLAGKDILIIDKDPKNTNDRTWSFWTKQATLFDEIIHRSWNKITFHGGGYHRVIDLGDYTYNTIRGIDFYNFIKRNLKKIGTVSWLKGTVSAIQDKENSAQVTVDGQQYEADWVFDSLFNEIGFEKNPQKCHYLMQHFKGWEIETPQDFFDTSSATMFDFRTPQKEEMRFMYLLPFTPRRALVEFTLFTGNLLNQQDYEQALRAYIGEVLKLQDYRIVEEENGIIPMTDHPFSRRGGSRIMHIGTKGGLNKASTGYAFLRIQHDCGQIIKALVTSNQPFYNQQDNRRYQIYDSMLLQIMHRHGALSEPIFATLFKKNPIDRLFRFLDEETSFDEDLKVMSSVPPWPFIRAFLKVKGLGRV
jgi:lycopene beta-cyclase